MIRLVVGTVLRRPWLAVLWPVAIAWSAYEAVSTPTVSGSVFAAGIPLAWAFVLTAMSLWVRSLLIRIIVVVALMSLSSNVAKSALPKAGLYPVGPTYLAAKALGCMSNVRVDGCSNAPRAVQLCRQWSTCPVTLDLKRRLIRLAKGPDACGCNPVYREGWRPARIRYGWSNQLDGYGNQFETSVAFMQAGSSWRGAVYEMFDETKVGNRYIVSDIYCQGQGAEHSSVLRSPLVRCT